VPDHPTHIKDQPGADFLKLVPTAWDDTKVLDAEVAQHLALVRRKGNTWYMGALTDRNQRDIPLKLDFLGESRRINYSFIPLGDGIPFSLSIV
jgi:alpha-glucosidase